MRTVKTKPSSTKPVGGAKRLCQDRPQPDVTTPKAMKDPNWRTRQDTGSSADIENVMPHMDQFASKLYPQLAQFHSNHSSQDDRGSSDFSIVERYSSESSSSSENLVKIVKKIDLKPVDGRQMCIFELDIDPETRLPTIAGDDRGYVKVSRNTTSTERDSSSGTQVTGSSQNVQKIYTPDVFQLVTLDRLCCQSASSTSSHPQLHELRSIYERDKRIDNSFHPNSPVTRDRTPADEPIQSPQTAIRKGRDQAFERLIQRLNRDNHTAATKPPRSPMKAQRKPKPPGLEYTNNMFGNFRRPTAGEGRRNQTTSDFKVNYWDHSQSSMTSREGSENTVQVSNKQNTWNPKAREFLSLGHQQNSRRPLPWDTGVIAASQPSQPSQEKASHNLNSVPQSASATWQKANARPFNPYLVPQDQNTIPNCSLNVPVAPLGTGFNLAPGPETFITPQYLPGNSAAQPSVFPVPPVSSIQAPMMPFNLTAQQIAAAQQMAALPYLASLASLGPMPLLTGLEKPNFPANCHRPAVPKPILPNAGAQLAYEEWIEWRKANEPGYAVECKARQQRRSQRVRGPKNDSGDKPVESQLAPAKAVADA